LVKRAAETTDSRLALESVLAYITNRPLRTWTDSDAERFEAQAAYLGNLWRAELGEYPISALPPDLQARSQKVLDELLGFLKNIDQDKRVVRAAIQALFERLKE
jgi:hypothetical protein